MYGAKGRIIHTEAYCNIAYCSGKCTGFFGPYGVILNAYHAGVHALLGDEADMYAGPIVFCMAALEITEARHFLTSLPLLGI